MILKYFIICKKIKILLKINIEYFYFINFFHQMNAIKTIKK